MRHAEALLLVDDQQPQIFELHILAEQLVRADDDVRLAGQQVFQHRLGVLGIARKLLDAHGKARKPREEVLIVLPGEQRRRHQHGDLLGIHDCLEAGAHSDLGLAIADIAQEQAVHDLGALHVLLDLLDALELSRRLGIGKVVLKLPLPDGVLRKGIALCLAAFAVDLDQVFCELLDRGARLGLSRFPFAPAQLGKPRLLLVRADVFVDAPDLRRRDEQPIAVAVFDLHVVRADARDFHRLESQVFALAVHLVHDDVARMQVGQQGDLLGLLWLPGARLARPPPQDVLHGKEDGADALRLKALLDGKRQHAHARGPELRAERR